MLKVKKLSKKFKNIQALKDVSFSLVSHDFVVIMGPNGTGKSTLFDIVSGRTLPDEGSIHIDGVDITTMSEEKRALMVGRLFQNTYLGSCSSLTVRENLAMATLKDRPARLTKGVSAFPKEALEEIFESLNLSLEKLLDTPMGALSGGQRQIISFVMAVLQTPKVLLLDEPTAALDPSSATQLLTFATEFAKQHCIPTLLITHDPLIAKHVGNKLWILDKGIIACEYGLEKKDLDPKVFLHTIDYENL